jgi:hypothetical protein
VDAAVFTQAAQDPGALDVIARPYGGKQLTLDAYAVARVD